MGIRVRVTLGATLALASAAALAQNPAGCASVKFSDDVLARFPRAQEACLDVISRGGQDYAVFNARLSEVRGNTMRVRFQLPDGTFGPTQSVTPPRDFRVLINGTPTRVADLAPNQELKAYVEVSRPVLALEPADTGQQMVIVPLVAEEAVEEERVAANPAMPATAGPAPIFATFGVLLACAALSLRAVFRLRALRRSFK
ncbi:hypothetical protein ACFPN2_31185 [Steroidobacter flavus]|uniref:Secreted protein n=1 Tax=Steroidobacter flavus TaxID=1842136 RepID=A0ABV8T156_9GAMM